MIDSPEFIQAYRESTNGSLSDIPGWDDSSSTVGTGTLPNSDESIPKPYEDMAPAGTTSSADLVERMAHKHPEIIRQMLSSDPNIRLPADSIMLAIRENDTEFAKLLLDYGASASGLVDGITPLCAALICHRLDDHQDDMVDLLLSRGADVDEVCPELILPHHALQGFVTTQPIDHTRHDGIPTYCQTCAGEKDASTTGFYPFDGYMAYNVAPIHLAALYRCRVGPLQAILACRAKPHATYSFVLSQDPMDLASSKKFAQDRYPPIGAANISALHDCSGSHVSTLATSGAPLDAKDSALLTPLSWAILAADIKKVEALLLAGCPLKSAGPNHGAITIWFQSISRPISDTDPTLESRLAVLDLLLSAGADTTAFVQTVAQNWPIGTRVEFEASMIKSIPGKPNFWQHCNELIKTAWQVSPERRRKAFLEGTEAKNMKYLKY
jgi:ankyrin repeat protein